MRTASAAARSPIEPPNPLAARAPEPTAGGRPESRRTTGAPAGAASRGRRVRRLSFGPSEHRDRWRPEDRATGSPMGNTAQGAARQPIETDDPLARARERNGRRPTGGTPPRRRAGRPGQARWCREVVGLARLFFRRTEHGDRMETREPSGRGPKVSTAPENSPSSGRKRHEHSPASASERPAAGRSRRRARRLSLGPAEHGDRTAIGRPNAGSPKGSTAPETARRPVEPGDLTGRSRSGRDRRRPTGRTPPRRRVGPPGQARCRVIVGLADSPPVVRNTATEWWPGAPATGRRKGGQRPPSASEPAAPPARAPERTATRPGGLTPHCRRPGRTAPAQRGLVARLADSPSVVRNTATEWRPENRTARVRR